jgi:hypothetical protein
MLGGEVSAFIFLNQVMATNVLVGLRSFNDHVCEAAAVAPGVVEAPSVADGSSGRGGSGRAQASGCLLNFRQLAFGCNPRFVRARRFYVLNHSCVCFAGSHFHSQVCRLWLSIRI